MAIKSGESLFSTLLLVFSGFIFAHVEELLKKHNYEIFRQLCFLMMLI